MKQNTKHFWIGFIAYIVITNVAVAIAARRVVPSQQVKATGGPSPILRGPIA